jgi:hypothetical protein
MPRAEPGYHELRAAGDRVIGTLRFLPKPAVRWGSTDRQSARGEVGPLDWDLSIERKGISGAIGASVTALIDGGRTGTLTCGALFATGVLSLASGRRLMWNGSVLERMPCAFADDSGRSLVRINSGSFLTRVNGTVDVEPEASDMSEWPLLVVLAMYLRLLMNRVWD